MRTCDATHIAFDLDFTLCAYALTTAQVITKAFARCLVDANAIGRAGDLADEYDALWRELERTATSVHELRLDVWRRILRGRGVGDTLAAPIATAYGEIRRETGVRLFDGVPEMLARLGARGYRLGLLTNGLSEMQWEKIRNLNLERHFDVLVIAGDIGWSKPDGRAFAVLLDRLGARPAEALFVGDSYALDIVGAHDAGMRTAWISPHGAISPGPVAPDYVLSSAVEIGRLLP